MSSTLELAIEYDPKKNSFYDRVSQRYVKLITLNVYINWFALVSIKATLTFSSSYFEQNAKKLIKSIKLKKNSKIMFN